MGERMRPSMAATMRILRAREGISWAWRAAGVEMLATALNLWFATVGEGVIYSWVLVMGLRIEGGGQMDGGQL